MRACVRACVCVCVRERERERERARERERDRQTDRDRDGETETDREYVDYGLSIRCSLPHKAQRILEILPTKSKTSC